MKGPDLWSIGTSSITYDRNCLLKVCFETHCRNGRYTTDEQIWSISVFYRSVDILVILWKCRVITKSIQTFTGIPR